MDDSKKKEILDKWNEYFEENKKLSKERQRRTYEQQKDNIRRYQKKYYEEHPEKLLEKQSIYYERHKDDLLFKGRKWAKTHPDKVKVSAQRYYQKNKSKISIKQKEYYNEHRDEIIKKQLNYYWDNRQKCINYAVKYKRMNGSNVKNKTRSIVRIYGYPDRLKMQTIKELKFKKYYDAEKVAKEYANNYKERFVTDIIVYVRGISGKSKIAYERHFNNPWHTITKGRGGDFAYTKKHENYIFCKYYNSYKCTLDNPETKECYFIRLEGSVRKCFDFEFDENRKWK